MEWTGLSGELLRFQIERPLAVPVTLSIPLTSNEAGSVVTRPSYSSAVA
jgi:hypothetical protein